MLPHARLAGAQFPATKLAASGSPDRGRGSAIADRCGVAVSLTMRLIDMTLRLSADLASSAPDAVGRRSRGRYPMGIRRSGWPAMAITLSALALTACST